MTTFARSWEIPKNKNVLEAGASNYNSGIVRMKVEINQRCPFTHFYQQANLNFNSISIQTLPDAMLESQIAYLEGEPGIFLKPKISYKSNFLVISDGSDTMEDLDPWEAVGFDETNLASNENYRDDHTWVTVNDLFGGIPLLQSNVLTAPSDIKEATPRWKYYRDNCDVSRSIPGKEADKNPGEAVDSGVLFVGTANGLPYAGARKPSLGFTVLPDIPDRDPDWGDDEREGARYSVWDKVNGYSITKWSYIDGRENTWWEKNPVDEADNTEYPYYILKEEFGEQTKDIFDSDVENWGGNVITTAEAKAMDEGEEDKLKGVHWGVQKKTNLFWGEDFFIEFRLAAEARADAPNVDSKKLDITHKYIDSMLNASGQEIPDNFAVANYEISRGADGDPTEFKYVANSGEAYNLNKQVYIVILIREAPGKWQTLSQGGYYYIIIPFNSNPMFVKVYDNKSYCLSRYEERTGGDLFERRRFRMTVRHHLGAMVITFGKDDSPWIIRQNPVNKDEPPLMQIGESEMFIYGGNLPMGFNFGVLQYNFISTVSLPAAPKGVVSRLESEFASNNTFSSNQKFKLPKSNINYVTLSDFEGGDQFDAPLEWNAAKKGYDWPVDLNDQLARRQPYYTCDAQEIKECTVGEHWDITPPFFSFHNLLKMNSVNMPIPDDWVDPGAASDAPVTGIPYFIKEKTDGALSCLRLSSATEKSSADPNMTVFKVNMQMEAGGHQFPSGWFCPSCKTPIATSILLVSVPDGDPLWTAGGTPDVSDLLMEFTESWSASDYSIMEHTGTLKFYDRYGGQMPYVSGGGTSDSDIEFLDGLQDKAFYVRVSVGYPECNYTKLTPGEYYPLFTGIGLGGTWRLNAGGERLFETQLVDYTYVMKNSLIFNSPFFDGLDDRWAVWQISKLCNFRDREQEDTSFYIKEAALSNQQQYEGRARSGQKFFSTFYQLPGARERLFNPAFRFKQTQYWYDAIKIIAQKAGKMFYFDCWGYMRYEDWPFKDDIFTYFEDPSTDIPQLHPQSTDIAAYYVVNPHGFGQTLFNTASQESGVSDVYNNIWLFSTTPERTPLMQSSMNWTSLTDPDSVGFLGFVKTMRQDEGMFGSKSSLLRMLAHYQKMFKPPKIVRFETFGVPLKALDVIQVNTNKLVVLSVSSTISAKENKWWQTIEGEWLGE